MERKKSPWTMSVPAAGKKYYGIGRSAAYRAARPYEEAQPGEIPTVEVGGLKRAVVSRLERMLSGEESK
jgi:hypothetical protein